MTMSKPSHNQMEKKLKISIDDFAAPILKQLEEAKNHEDFLHLKDDIEEICVLLGKTKGVLKNREKWDSMLMGQLERIQRQIDFVNENKGEGNEGDKWVLIKENLENLLENHQVIVPMISDESEIDEPSIDTNYDDDSTNQFDEYINRLNPKHKDCLFSLGIFPENAQLKKRLLLYWWIGLGLPSRENKNVTTEQAAETFFCDLVNKKILQPKHTRRHNQVVDCCIINPTIHRKLKLLTNMNNNEGTLRFYCDAKSKVRALLNVNDQYLNSKQITKEVLSNHPTMQVAQFGSWHCTKPKDDNMVEGNVSETTNIEDHIEVDETDFLTKLGKKVAFLSLRSISGIQGLPDSIGKLEDLRIMDLRACHNLQNLPQKRWSKSRKILRLVTRQQKWFKNLTYLDISECFLLHHIPKWVCELFNLEVLKGFVASNAGKGKELCMLSDLSKLKKLRKLNVRIAMRLDPDDLSCLECLESLTVLTLAWGTYKQSGGKEIKGQNNGNGKVQTISFPKNLEKLDIRSYPKANASELLNPQKLQKLKRLYVRGGKLTKIENKPGWKVEILRLRYLKNLDFNLYNLSSIFPSLKCMEYEQCINCRYVPEIMCYWSLVTDGPFPSVNYDPNYEVLIKDRVQLTITRNMMVPLASHKQMMMLELTGWDSISDRPGLDLVLVLDVSTRMNIKELKTALLFVINNLSFIDRLSIVTFSSEATTIFDFSEVTKTSQKEAETLVTNLVVTNDVDSNIKLGLEMGLKILKYRSDYSGRVSSIMLLSAGGRDLSFYPETGNVAVHTFYLGPISNTQGLGMPDIAKIAYRSMGGTFSDVSIAENLTKAFSVCLAGLLTVAVQDLTLTISPIKKESTIYLVDQEEPYLVDQEKPYPISTNKADGSVTVKFGDLYSKEVRKILVQLELPDTDKERDSSVLKISCSYKAKEKLFEGKPGIVVDVKRTAEVSARQHRELPQVLVEVNRRKIVEKSFEGKLIDAQHILENLVKIEPHFSKDFNDLMRDELQQVKFDGTRRAFRYSFFISHCKQRTAVRGNKAESSLIFSTPTMMEFLKQAEKFGADTSNPSEDS